MGDKVFYTGPSRSHGLQEGYELVHGRQGEVTGSASLGRVEGNGVRVFFPGNEGSFPLYLSVVRRLPQRCARAAHTRKLWPHAQRPSLLPHAAPSPRRPHPRGKRGRRAPYRPTTPGATGREAAGVAVGGRVYRASAGGGGARPISPSARLVDVRR